MHQNVRRRIELGVRDTPQRFCRPERRDRVLSARRQASHEAHRKRPPAPVAVNAFQPERSSHGRGKPHVHGIRFDAGEALLGDANNLEQDAVHQQGLADRVSRAGKARLPHRVTDHGDRVRTGDSIVLRDEQAAGGRADSQHLQEIMRDDTRADLLHVGAATKIDALGKKVSANARERWPTVAHRHVVDPEARPAIWRLHRARVAFDVEPPQRPRGRHRRRRTQEQAIDDAEDRRRAADAECERRHRGRGKGRPLAKHANGEADVLPHALDHRFPADVPHPILHRLNAADLHACRANGRVAAHAAGHVSLR